VFIIVWEMQKQRNLILNDRRRNRLAMTMLREFSQGVDAVRELQQSAKGPRGHQQPYADYLISVQQSTDALSQRTRRAEMLRQLFAGLFEKRDDRRTFSPEQRRLIWNSEDEKVCTMCGEPLDWTNFQIDHVKAYARGGRTLLSNAALTCAPCNAGKGGR
jgi:5-methylcytosine-specific restriction endonuclease McrA